MKTLITIILLLSISSEKFTIIGKWRNEDAHSHDHLQENTIIHQHLLEITFFENQNIEFINPEIQKNSPKNKVSSYSIQKTNNDSIVLIDIESITRKENQDPLVKNGYCTVKFLNPNKIILTDFATKSDREKGKGLVILLNRVN